MRGVGEQAGQTREALKTKDENNGKGNACMHVSDD